jgi:hypothetical protein
MHECEKFIKGRQDELMREAEALGKGHVAALKDQLERLELN